MEGGVVESSGIETRKRTKKTKCVQDWRGAQKEMYLVENCRGRFDESETCGGRKVTNN